MLLVPNLHIVVEAGRGEGVAVHATMPIILLMVKDKHVFLDWPNHDRLIGLLSVL